MVAAVTEGGTTEVATTEAVTGGAVTGAAVMEGGTTVAVIGVAVIGAVMATDSVTAATTERITMRLPCMGTHTLLTPRIRTLPTRMALRHTRTEACRMTLTATHLAITPIRQRAFTSATLTGVITAAGGAMGTEDGVMGTAAGMDMATIIDALLADEAFSVRG